jgi:hypothetical protein
MTINRPLQRKLFMQQGGEPSLEMMQPQQQMMVQPTPEESTQALFQQGEQIGQGILSQINEAQDYEQLMNAIRGDEMPVEGRREELSGLVGKQDSQDTPESVLTLVQPTMALIETQGGIDGLMQQVSGDVPVEGNMAQGVGSMLMAGQPTEPVQMAEGGVVRKMATGTNLPLNDSSATGGQTVTGGETATGEEIVTYEDIEALMKNLDSSNVPPSPNIMNRFMRPPVDQKTIDKESAVVGGLSLAMGDTSKPTSFGYDFAKAGLDALGYRSKARDSNLKSMLASAQLGATKQVGGVQLDSEGFKFIASIDSLGNITQEYLKDDKGNKIKGLTKSQELKKASDLAQDAVSRKENEKLALTAQKEIYGLETQDALFDQALNTLINNPEVDSGLGLLGQLLPDALVDESAVALRKIGSELGIAVINSATFGALSEKELKLALSTNLPMGLNRMELIGFIKAKQKAQKKYRRILETRADELAGRTVSEYRAIQAEKRKENNRILDLFDNEKYSEGITATLFDAGTIYEVVDKKGKITKIGRTNITKDIWKNVMSAEDRKIVIDRIDQLLADRPN